MRCIAKPVEAVALPIVGVVLVMQTGKRRTYLEVDDNGTHCRLPLTPDVTLHAAPRRGDILVTQANGERQILPPEVFEQRYLFIHQRG